MTSAVATPSKHSSSPFLSLFRSKKKVNGTISTDNMKASTTAEPLTKEEKKKAKKVDSKTLPSDLERKKKGRHKGTFWDTKSMSLDDLCDMDPNYLVEALETMADDKPMVARSIPKHAKITRREDKSMKNCLFEQDVYDSMLSDSLRVCDMLQSHLDDCIVSVRARSPETVLDISQDCADSGRGASSASSTISTTVIHKKPLKSCVRADV